MTCAPQLNPRCGSQRSTSWWSICQTVPLYAPSYCSYHHTLTNAFFVPICLVCFFCLILLFYSQHFQYNVWNEKLFLSVSMVFCGIMLCTIISIIGFPCPPIYYELLLSLLVSQTVKTHIHCLCSLWLYFSICHRSAIGLSVCNGVGGMFVSYSSKIILVYTASLSMMYKAANSSSVADDMACFVMWAMLRTAPLFCDMVELLDRKKCPPALLHAFGSLR